MIIKNTFIHDEIKAQWYTKSEGGFFFDSVYNNSVYNYNSVYNNSVYSVYSYSVYSVYSNSVYTLRPTILALRKIHASRVLNQLSLGEYFLARVETSLDCLHFILIT